MNQHQRNLNLQYVKFFNIFLESFIHNENLYLFSMIFGNVLVKKHGLDHLYLQIN